MQKTAVLLSLFLSVPLCASATSISFVGPWGTRGIRGLVFPGEMDYIAFDVPFTGTASIEYQSHDGWIYWYSDEPEWLRVVGTDPGGNLPATYCGYYYPWMLPEECVSHEFDVVSMWRTLVPLNNVSIINFTQYGGGDFGGPPFLLLNLVLTDANGQTVYTTIPEPASVLLVLTGLPWLRKLRRTCGGG